MPLFLYNELHCYTLPCPWFVYNSLHSSSVTRSLFTSCPVATSMAVNTVPDALVKENKNFTSLHILTNRKLKFSCRNINTKAVTF